MVSTTRTKRAQLPQRFSRSPLPLMTSLIGSTSLDVDSRQNKSNEHLTGNQDTSSHDTSDCRVNPRGQSEGTALSPRASHDAPPVDPVADALAFALRAAAAESRWDIVAQISGELQARRLSSGNVAVLAAKRPRK